MPTVISHTKVRKSVAIYISAFNIVRSVFPKFTRDFTLVSLLFVITSLVGALLPYLLKITAEAFIDTGGSGYYGKMFLWSTFAYASCWTVAEVLKNIKGIFSAGALGRANAALTEAALDSLLKASFSIQRNFNPAVISSNINRGATAFSSLTVAVFWTLIPIGFEIGVALYFLAQALGIFYASAFSISVVALIGLAGFIAMRSRTIHADIMNAQNQISSYAVTRLGVPLDIRINAAHEKEYTVRGGVLEYYVETIARTNRKMGLLLSLQALATGGLLAISVLALAYYREASHLRAGDFVMIAGYIGMLTMQLRMIAGSCIDIQRNVVSLEALIEYTDYPSIGFSPMPSVSEKEKTEFDINNISVGHGKKIAFKDLSFSVKVGEMVAISAPSGFGKSTLINLMVGMEAPIQGKVYYQGRRITPDCSDQLIREVAVVLQKPGLVPGTLRENVLIGINRAVDDHEIVEVLHQLQLTEHEEANQAALLNRQLNPQGGGMSGGEIQRICIARAVLRGSNTIILDEPTAAMGEKLAIDVISYIRTQFKTVILTSHNPTVIALADRVIDLMTVSTQLDTSFSTTSAISGLENA